MNKACIGEEPTGNPQQLLHRFHLFRSLTPSSSAIATQEHGGNLPNAGFLLDRVLQWAGAAAGQCLVKEQDRLPLTSLPGFGALSLSSVMLILVFVLIPPLHGISRSIIKPWVVFHVERGLAWVTLAQKNQRSVLTALSTMSCFTVSISFYISFLPLLMWVSRAANSLLWSQSLQAYE